MPTHPRSFFIDLGELLDQIADGTYKVNYDYQRSGSIWPVRARSFLVETILLGMPIPRVLVNCLSEAPPPHQWDIIDGQQRCFSLRQFRAGKFALSSDVDDQRLVGKRFDELSARLQEKFNSYQVPIDEYSNYTPAQIRQVFRRLNFYTAPLVPAEQRHAQFSGELGRFVEDQAKQWKPLFLSLGVFSRKNIDRKAHEQLMAEVVDAMANGISTPTAKTLRVFYKAFDSQFPSSRNFRRRLDAARELVAQVGPMQPIALSKHYQMFALMLASIHSISELTSLTADLGPQAPQRADSQVAHSLDMMGRAINEKQEHGRYAQFWAASHEKTNTRENRLKRCQYYFEALTGIPHNG